MKKIFLILILMAHLSGCSVSDIENPDDSMTSRKERVIDGINADNDKPQHTNDKFSQVKIGKQVFQVETADTEELRQKGLMFREKLEKNAGMFFIFDHSKKHSFWMKNTLISLDIIWISEGKKVVDIQTIQPCITKICESYQPRIDSKYVLEVGAGIFRGNLDDEVEFSF